MTGEGDISLEANDWPLTAPSGQMERGRFRALVQDFDPIWFTLCMNLGVLGIIMHQFPYQFNGLRVLATIAFMGDLVFFILTSAVFLLRLAWFRSKAYEEIVGNISTLALTAPWPIAWLTLVAFVVLVVSDAGWGGYDWSMVAYVMWWIGASWMVATLFFVYLHLIIRHNTPDRQQPPLFLMAAVGLATVGTVGGLLASYAHGLTAAQVIPVIIFGFCATGAGIFLAIILYSHLFHQLLTVGFPSAPEITSMFIFIGPVGQSAAAVQLLGAAAHTSGRFAEKNQGMFLTKLAAAPLDVFCTLLALLMVGLGAIWCLFAFAAVLYKGYRRELTWTPTWNAVIFPTGTFTTALLLLGVELDSDFFRVITAIFLVFLVVVFFVNLAFIIWEVVHSRVLIVPTDWRLVDKERND